MNVSTLFYAWLVTCRTLNPSPYLVKATIYDSTTAIIGESGDDKSWQYTVSLMHGRLCADAVTTRTDKVRVATLSTSSLSSSMNAYETTRSVECNYKNSYALDGLWRSLNSTKLQALQSFERDSDPVLTRGGNVSCSLLPHVQLGVKKKCHERLC